MGIPQLPSLEPGEIPEHGLSKKEEIKLADEKTNQSSPLGDKIVQDKGKGCKIENDDVSDSDASHLDDRDREDTTVSHSRQCSMTHLTKGKVIEPHSEKWV